MLDVTVGQDKGNVDFVPFGKLSPEKISIRQRKLSCSSQIQQFTILLLLPSPLAYPNIAKTILSPVTKQSLYKGSILTSSVDGVP